MAKAKNEVFPDEIFLNAAIKDRRAVKKELSMKAIGTPDPRLQQRVKTDVNHVRLLEGILRDGDQLRPIIVFEDEDGKFHMADGFHRHEAHVNFGAASIWAWVIQGAWRDAMIYSTMCNRNLCLRRTPEDVKKAVMTLLDDEEWRGMANRVIARHCGVGKTAVDKYRLEHSVERGVRLPEKVKRSDGSLQPYRNQATTGVPAVSRINSGGHRATIGKRLAYLGTDPIRAQKNLEEFVAKESEKERSLHRVALVNFLCRRNLSFSPPDSRGRFKTFGLGSVFCGHGAIVVSENFPRRSSDSPIVHAAIGRVLLARQLIDPSARAVVVCYTEETPPELIEAGRALGVEFLTPDELVASIKGEDSRESA